MVVVVVDPAGCAGGGDRHLYVAVLVAVVVQILRVPGTNKKILR